MSAILAPPVCCLYMYMSRLQRLPTSTFPVEETGPDGPAKSNWMSVLCLIHLSLQNSPPVCLCSVPWEASLCGCTKDPCVLDIKDVGSQGSSLPGSPLRPVTHSCTCPALAPSNPQVPDPLPPPSPSTAPCPCSP